MKNIEKRIRFTMYTVRVQYIIRFIFVFALLYCWSVSHGFAQTSQSATTENDHVETCTCSVRYGTVSVIARTAPDGVDAPTLANGLCSGYCSFASRANVAPWSVTTDGGVLHSRFSVNFSNSSSYSGTFGSAVCTGENGQCVQVRYATGGLDTRQAQGIAGHELGHVFLRHVSAEIGYSEGLADHALWVIWQQWPVSSNTGRSVENLLQDQTCGCNSVEVQAFDPISVDGNAQNGHELTDCGRALRSSFWQYALSGTRFDNLLQLRGNITLEGSVQQVSGQQVGALVQAWRENRLGTCCPSATTLASQAPSRWFRTRAVRWVTQTSADDLVNCRSAVALHDNEFYPAVVLYSGRDRTVHAVDNDGHMAGLCWHGNWLVAAGGRNNPDHPTVLFIDTVTDHVVARTESPWSARGRPWSDFWNSVTCGSDRITVIDRDYNRTRNYPYPQATPPRAVLRVENQWRVVQYVFVDGTHVGSVPVGESRDFQIHNGHHRVVAADSQDGTINPVVDEFDISDGRIEVMTVHR